MRDVKEGLVAGRVGRHLHQNLVKEQRLQTETVDGSKLINMPLPPPRRTVLYIFSCMLDLRLKSLSDPEEENCLALCVRSRKSLKRKAHSSLLLLVL